MTPKNYIIERGKISFQGKMLLFSVIFATGKRQYIGKSTDAFRMYLLFYMKQTGQYEMEFVCPKLDNGCRKIKERSM